MFIVEFSSRPDGGPREVGPFLDRETAASHAARVIGAGSGSWCVVPLASAGASLEAAGAPVPR